MRNFRECPGALGSVEGNIVADGRIVIRRNARLIGNLKMAGIEIEDGAYFKGNIDITGVAQPAEAGG